jgi:hypothetical protein
MKDIFIRGIESEVYAMVTSRMGQYLLVQIAEPYRKRASQTWSSLRHYSPLFFNE